MTTKAHNNDHYIFGLDIGTRSIVGVVGYKDEQRFNVIAHHIIEHDTRAMIDGQIHDVAQVADTIKRVKLALEKQLNFKLSKVCIAAAGRVLKTAMIHVTTDVDANIIIDEPTINSLELLGMEKAHQEVNASLSEMEMGYHCVGYTVSKYYLNDYEIATLEGHKGIKIGADVLATFLPQEVVESLYQVVGEAGLDVYSLTLEPIAAIQIAIPVQYRLLNIALVDIGAGTSDIAITKEGSIIAYGMIPMAGDELTESLVHHYLVDFKTAEAMKRKVTGRAKTISYKDVIGLKHTVSSDDVRSVLLDVRTKLAKRIADKIMELNGGKATNAVFVVGGGGQVTDFTANLAESLDILPERVALRGKEVLGDVNFGETQIKVGPDLVTPIGICMTGLLNNSHDFIQVYLNDNPVKLYDNNRLTVLDVAAFKGIDPKKLMPKKGSTLSFTLNGQPMERKGSMGEAATIHINQAPASLTSSVKMNDYITIVYAKEGKPAVLSTYGLLNELNLNASFDGKTYTLKPAVYVNGQKMAMNVDIHDGDEIRLELPTIQSFLMAHQKFSPDQQYLLNGQEVDLSTQLSDHDLLTSQSKTEIFKDIMTDKASKDIDNTFVTKNSKQIFVIVNQHPVSLEGKEHYIFVDIFDVYDFDLSKPQGNVVCTINGEKASYMGEIKDGDRLEVYWQKA